MSFCKSSSIDEACFALKRGELVVFPTETVFGLGADALQKEAVQAIYALKGRPSNNPLIFHVASLNEAMEWAIFDDEAIKLASKCWPGPLTLVLPAKKKA